MTQAPVLALPDCKFTFLLLETDACDSGIGAVLMKDSRPISFWSKALGVKNRGVATYEKELLEIWMAVSRWRHYRTWRPFVRKTDHQSFKHLLEQKLINQLQHITLA